MVTPLVGKIGQASKDAWPAVQASFASVVRSTAELAGISEQVLPRVEAYIDRGPGMSVRRRKICEETVWALANTGWLRTGGERQVVLAAKKWADLSNLDSLATDAQLTEAELGLVEALGTLPEYITKEAAS